MDRVKSNGGFIRHMRLAPHSPKNGYPFTIPVIACLARSAGIKLDSGITFFVGDNGTGKSTLIEALAVAAGFNPEGGSQNFRFATRATESSLGDYLILSWGVSKPRTGFFLRAESYYNVASEIERLDQEPGSPPLLPLYGGISPHERSHGESFLDLAIHRFGPNGLYILDEPEAALSPQGCLALMLRIGELVSQNCQFVVATHSPILLAMPQATILQIDADGEIDKVSYDNAEPVKLTRAILENPQLFLRPLLDNDERKQ